eukprot:CAMPEP_0198315632 /NCGR_PEP_ID=MMETSP1450-20131203/5839_1 /TAXON_ID=753684 ORGANISM="Madagascaria erythrocladiodes, Strain CCMP3234" /NCGR_SAMPLE_ID=MMETSP1450 /ASSEMBLY_ACC=CAM_ASM_001115 /LENGTH=218 /DNA_ID=CAMNT_0044018755 /DNA_START=344 /DNA_END=997 /DNA_ORIENTATION=+
MPSFNAAFVVTVLLFTCLLEVRAQEIRNWITVGLLLKPFLISTFSKFKSDQIVEALAGSVSIPEERVTLRAVVRPQDIEDAFPEQDGNTTLSSMVLRQPEPGIIAAYDMFLDPDVGPLDEQQEILTAFITGGDLAAEVNMKASDIELAVPPRPAPGAMATPAPGSTVTPAPSTPPSEMTPSPEPRGETSASPSPVADDGGGVPVWGWVLIGLGAALVA